MWLLYGNLTALHVIAMTRRTIRQLDGKRKIIDTFINAIYVYDDHFKIGYNGNNKEETVSIEALENSSTFLRQKSWCAPLDFSCKIDHYRIRISLPSVQITFFMIYYT